VDDGNAIALGVGLGIGCSFILAISRYGVFFIVNGEREQVFKRMPDGKVAPLGMQLS